MICAFRFPAVQERKVATISAVTVETVVRKKLTCCGDIVMGDSRICACCTKGNIGARCRLSRGQLVLAN